MKRTKLMVVLLAFGMVVSAAYATESLVQPTGAAASASDGNRPATDAIDGSGLSDATIVETGDAIPTAYPSHGTDSGNMWRSPNGDDGIGDWIAFELGDSYDLTGFHLWNYNEIWTGDPYDETQRGVQIASVEYSTDNQANWISLGDMTFTQATGTSNYTGEDYVFHSPLLGVTDIRFTVVSNFNNADRSGISEVRFIETDAISFAHTPDPLYDEIDVEVELISRVVPGAVSWAAPNDPNIDTVFGYNVYIDPNETRILNATPASTDLEFKSLHSGGQTGTSFDPGADLEYLTTYYWRVDAVVDYDYVPGTTPSTVTGSAWSFTTIAAEPVVNAVEPAISAIDPGEDVHLSVTGLNIETYQWYKVDDTVDEKLVNGTDYSGVKTDTLTILDMQLVDEGSYYCVVHNTAGSDSNINDAALVMTKRLIIHYPLDNVIGGTTPDVVSGYDMTLVSDNAGTDFPMLVGGKIGTGSLWFDNSDSANENTWGQYASAGDVDLEYMGEGFTVEFWMNFAGDNGTTSGLIARRNSWGANNMMWDIEIRPTGAVYVATNGRSTSEVIASHNDWTHIAVTHDGNSSVRMYVNGEFEAQDSAMPYWGGVNSPLMLAAANYDNDSELADNFFNGLIDDVKIYNYPRSAGEIAQDYLAVNGGWVCDNELPSLGFDINGDCQVDISDFANFAAQWLDSNRIYPFQ